MDMATGLENLRIYQQAVRLEKFVHRVVNEKFPLEEKYRSCDQLKRSSSSVADNIAESYGRYHFKDKMKHVYIARGEAEETKSGFHRAYLKHFISQQMSSFVCNKYSELLRGINRYIAFLGNNQRKQKN
jgi:four helix bundle protein